MKTVNDLLKENPDFGISGCVLDLSNQGLTSLEGLGNYEDVFETIDLSNNSISKIEKLDHLFSLKHLYLSFNQIQKIENLEALNLFTLDLYENPIQNPESVKELNVEGVIILKRKIKITPCIENNYERYIGI